MTATMIQDKNSLLQEYTRLREEERRDELRRQELPHLYSFGWYRWALNFFNSTNHVSLLCAGNQLSKSSSQIRKCIHWATEDTLWPTLWATKPTLFWYLYPSQEVINQECEVKWEPNFLPKGSMKDDPKYGWKWIKEGRNFKGIRFNSGVVLLFKSYSQKAEVLQTATVYYLATDEELPVELYDELMFRISSTDGYFSMVFTATLGQEFWRRAMEPTPQDEEALPNAYKLVVSAYDCLEYVDGRKSSVTLERIARMRSLCKNEAEVQRRIYGRFVKSTTGRTFPTFDQTKHFKRGHHVPADWFIYGGVDIGSGNGEELDDDGKKVDSKGHPSAIVFIAVSPDYSKGRVILGWRGDNQNTTAGDVVSKYMTMKKEHRLQVTQQSYDYGSADFRKIAESNGLIFMRAIKKRDEGIDLVNTLFKLNMLIVYDDDSGELAKLATELSTLDIATPKNVAKDDFCDALRYCAMQIPWNIQVQEEVIEDTPEEDRPSWQDRKDFYDGVGNYKGEEKQDVWGAEAELDEWADMFE